MSDRMSNRERIEALSGGEKVDRPAWSFWRHFYDEESTAEGLADAMVAWQRRHGFDFLKVNPRAQYHVEPWGARYRYPGVGHRPERISAPVGRPIDWDRIGPRSPTEGALGEQLQALRRIRAELGAELPIIETIFTPLSILGDLVEKPEQLVADLRAEPERISAALEAVTETFAGYAAHCLDAGADGIFLATTEWARRDVVTEEEYAKFGRPYDLRVLHAVRDASFNVLHVCGDNAMVMDLADYPVHAVSWAVTSDSTPSLEQASGRISGLLVGGVSHEALTAGEPWRALAEARAAHAATEGCRWILAGNCSIPVTTPDANLEALREGIVGGLGT